ncbi:hypothetical protein S245_035983, partial [Arachis hypogaea]
VKMEKSSKRKIDELGIQIQLSNSDDVVNSTHNTSGVGVNPIFVVQQEENAKERLKKLISNRVLEQKSRIKKELC